MSEAVTAYLGLGANLGDPIESIVSAREQLEKLAYVVSCRSSSLYWTSPVGYSNQPFFINVVVGLCWQGEIEQLFADIQLIESDLGRVRNSLNQNAPRIIDIDLLLFDDLSVDTASLVVPHPRILDRRFVIEPLLEIDPTITVFGKPLKALYQERLASDCYRDQEIYKLGQ